MIATCTIPSYSVVLFMFESFVNAAMCIFAFAATHMYGCVGPCLCCSPLCRNVRFLFIILVSGNAVLTYFGKWDFVEPQENYQLIEKLYVAPGTYVPCVLLVSCVWV